MNLFNFSSSSKLSSIFVVSILMIAGWAIIPAQAHHCKGPHQNDPGCDSGGGGGPLSLENSAIVYEGRDSIKVADADGGNQVTLLFSRQTQFWYPSWSPDGNFILFASDLNGPGIYSMRIDRQSDLVGAPVLIIPLNSVITKAAWSPVPTPDGEYKIAYGYFDGGKYAIYLVDVDVDAIGNVTLGTPFKLPTYLPVGLEEFEPSWSPDASQLAVTTYDVSLGRWGINTFILGTTSCGVNIPVCEVSGSRRDLIAELGSSPFDQYGAAGPSWPNKGTTGNKIALRGIPQQGENNDIWIIEFDDPGGVPTIIQNLTNTNGAAPPDRNEGFFTWSADDLQIMYQGWDYLCQPQKNNKRGYNLIVRNVDGTGFPPPACEEKMIVEGHAGMPSWWRNATGP